MKKYKAKSHVALSVHLPSGKSVRVSFTPLTGGGSVYYTDDKDLQSALRRHPKYGHLFKECEMPVVNAAPAPKPAKTPSDKETVSVTCLDDAKEYLVEKLGYSRTKLRSAKAIKDAAEKHGIVFEGI
jgi:hypothetical protein